MHKLCVKSIPLKIFAISFSFQADLVLIIREFDRYVWLFCGAPSKITGGGSDRMPALNSSGAIARQAVQLQ